MMELIHFNKIDGGVMRHVRTYCKLQDTTGQSTVEFAIVLGALLSILIALGLFNGLFSDGQIFDHIVVSASHNITLAVQGIVDVFAF